MLFSTVIVNNSVLGLYQNSFSLLFRHKILKGIKFKELEFI